MLKCNQPKKWNLASVPGPFGENAVYCILLFVLGPSDKSTYGSPDASDRKSALNSTPAAKKGKLLSVFLACTQETDFSCLSVFLAAKLGTLVFPRRWDQGL